VRPIRRRYSVWRRISGLRPTGDRAWDRRLLLKVLIGAIAGLLLAYCADRERRGCIAGGGKLVERTLVTRCEYPASP
jgi:hypothetical protein